MINGGVAIAVAIISFLGGKFDERRINQNEFNKYFNFGDNNNITIVEAAQNYQELQIENSSLSEQNTQYLDELDIINDKYKRLELESNNKIQELEEKLEAQTIAVLSSPDLKVLGEDITPTLMNYMARIDGYTYYLEGFLNTFCMINYQIMMV